MASLAQGKIDTLGREHIGTIFKAVAGKGETMHCNALYIQTAKNAGGSDFYIQPADGDTLDQCVSLSTAAIQTLMSRGDVESLIGLKVAFDVVQSRTNSNVRLAYDVLKLR